MPEFQDKRKSCIKEDVGAGDLEITIIDHETCAKIKYRECDGYYSED